MLTLFSSLVVLLFLAITALSGSLSSLLCALIAGTVYFGIMLVRAYGELPRLNLMRIIAICSGLFYFGGGSLAVSSRLLDGDNPYVQAFAYWRNYDPLPMCGAALLAFACSILAIYASNFIRFNWLEAIVTDRALQPQDPMAVLRERFVTIAICLSGSAVCTWLLAAGKLTVAGAAASPIIHQAGGEWLVIAAEAAPAMVLLIAHAILSRWSDGLTRLVAMMSAVPIGLATFTLGRRYIIAALAISVMALIVYRGVRLRAWQWVASIALALVVFFAVSGPFMVLRQAQTANRSVGISELLDAAVTGRQLAGTQHMDLADIADLSAARSDMMGELAQMTSRTPASNLHYGTGWITQLAQLVPHVFWPGKQAYLWKGMYNDWRICADAGLPPQDIASSLVLYSFGEVGWAAPIWYCLTLTVFLWIADRMAALFRSHTQYLMTLSTLLFFAFVSDNTYGGEIIQELRFLFAVGVATWVIRAFTFLPSQKRPISVGHRGLSGVGRATSP